MSKQILKFAIFLGILTVFSACNSKNKEVRTESDKVNQMRDGMTVANYKQENITVQNSLEATISSLATQMMINKKLDTNKPVIVTSFVRLDQFKTTSEFGRVVGESMIDELSNRGFNLIEFRGQMAISVNDKGEYFLSRKPHEIKKEVPSTYVVVGTYSRQNGKVILNARVIDNITGRVISSARSTFVHGLAQDCTMFGDCPPMRTIKIVKEK
ncbi:hypothetical protein CRU87_07695 [Aliarcobacter trophiarum LMG 25534]|uniref:FlgO domain-containing protein n=1 Tax=Aliarcobacter trophiarum LMG 25534 TaxID=1032241 RepID=A0AAD0QHN1_9BACT|nr:FlgO family outer membrane protein [Aliarcobacter trophiarum]AXK47999.1 hypothetical protein ATR_0106 [Aliarcobacter trophiarum LMG 25534]RXJ90056.1 hypothetical protein CRU87_07695 [Aliarcobacter trophiarum LMG 25534]